MTRYHLQSIHNFKVQVMVIDQTAALADIRKIEN